MWQRFKNGFRSFMVGRNGSDQLSFALLIAGIICSLISSLTGFMILYYAGMAIYIWSLFRMFSRNVSKRAEENRKYLSIRYNLKTNVSQFLVRMKNSRKYRYFRCPECKSRLRLPRKVGEVTVTCSKCAHQFRQKA